MDNYSLTPIKNIKDALVVRKIRNQCRLFMTNDRSDIGFVRQIVWFFSKYKKENKKNNMICFLFNKNAKPIGFGLIKKNEDKYLITGGLEPDQRGKGIGKILFKEIIEQTPSKVVFLEVLKSNIPARKIYENLGFKQI